LKEKNLNAIGSSWQFSRRSFASGLGTSQAVSLLPTRMAVCLPPGSCACATWFEKLSPVVWRASTSLATQTVRLAELAKAVLADSGG
jgi:hypothetical protein